MVIYLVTNLINGKVYVGQTIGDYRRRWTCHRTSKKGSCRALYRAIQKYGSQNFTIEVIAKASSRAELNLLEVFTILYFKSNKKEFGYNLTTGGDNNTVVNAEVRQKWSKIRKGRLVGSEQRQKISASMKGREFSVEHKNKLKAKRALQVKETTKIKTGERNNSTGYVGVSKKPNESRYIARVRVNNKTYHIGSFATALEASKERERFIRVNFPNLNFKKCSQEEKK